ARISFKPTSLIQYFIERYVYYYRKGIIRAKFSSIFNHIFGFVRTEKHPNVIRPNTASVWSVSHFQSCQHGETRNRGFVQILPVILLAVFAVTTAVVVNRIQTEGQDIRSRAAGAYPTPAPNEICYQIGQSENRCGECPFGSHSEGSYYRCNGAAICTPGAKSCNSAKTAVLTCKSDGSGHTYSSCGSGESCNAITKRCEAKKVYCNQEALSCGKDGSVLKCTDPYQMPTHYRNCTYGCSGGACRSAPTPTPTPRPICPNGTQWCSSGGGGFYTCDPNTGNLTKTKCPYGCENTGCKSPPPGTTTTPATECPDSNTRAAWCSGANFYTCNLSTGARTTSTCRYGCTNSGCRNPNFTCNAGICEESASGEYSSIAGCYADCVNTTDQPCEAVGGQCMSSSRCTGYNKGTISSDGQCGLGVCCVLPEDVPGPWSCNRDGQCVDDPNGEYTSKITCLRQCDPEPTGTPSYCPTAYCMSLSMCMGSGRTAAGSCDIATRPICCPPAGVTITPPSTTVTPTGNECPYECVNTSFICDIEYTAGECATGKCAVESTCVEADDIPDAVTPTIGETIQGGECSHDNECSTGRCSTTTNTCISCSDAWCRCNDGREFCGMRNINQRTCIQQCGDAPSTSGGGGYDPTAILLICGTGDDVDNCTRVQKGNETENIDLAAMCASNGWDDCSNITIRDPAYGWVEMSAEEFATFDDVGDIRATEVAYDREMQTADELSQAHLETILCESGDLLVCTEDQRAIEEQIAELEDTVAQRCQYTPAICAQVNQQYDSIEQQAMDFAENPEALQEMMEEVEDMTGEYVDLILECEHTACSEEQLDR
ncbi:hypothetical protein ACFL1P_01815, partial [Patescibacteria group bacterium]